MFVLLVFFSILSPVSRNSLGREFHSLGPSTENTRCRHEFRRYDRTVRTTNWWPVPVSWSFTV